VTGPAAHMSVQKFGNIVRKPPSQSKTLARGICEILYIMITE
jgi:hypothetical protein